MTNTGQDIVDDVKLPQNFAHRRAIRKATIYCVGPVSIRRTGFDLEALRTKTTGGIGELRTRWSIDEGHRLAGIDGTTHICLSLSQKTPVGSRPDMELFGDKTTSPPIDTTVFVMATNNWL